MTARPIRLLGDPMLRSKCNLVADPSSPAVRVVADDLRDSLKELKRVKGRGLGLSAPQVGAPIQLIFLELERRTLLVNPEIVDVGSNDFLLWDECFSLPDLMIRVQHAHQITVKYLDLGGKEHRIDFEGPPAHLIQHQIDHLNGVLAIDVATGFDPFCFRKEWEKHHAEEGRFSDPYPRIAPQSAELLG
ncbi:MAG: peptide deformylase [Gemmatimonadales bacterium]